MALTDLQIPSSKRGFYDRIQSVASRMDALMNEWSNLAEFINRMGTTDLDALGVPSGQVRTDLINFRVLLNEMVSLYNGNSVTPTNTPADVIEVLRIL